VLAKIGDEVWREIDEFIVNFAFEFEDFIVMLYKSR
jgi:hypothetical protein